MADDMSKIAARLVEKPRQEKWWDEEGVIYPVPRYQKPEVKGSMVAITFENRIYCLDANFGYAKLWESEFSGLAREITKPVFVVDRYIALSILRTDHVYDAVIIDLTTNEIQSHPISDSEKEYKIDMMGIGSPITPCASNIGSFFASYFGQLASHKEDWIDHIMNEDTRIRYTPLIHNEDLVVHLDDGEKTWLEWYDLHSLQLKNTSDKYDISFGISGGFAGTDPVSINGIVVCGFGTHLSAFDNDYNLLWIFRYPNIASIEDEEPIRVIVPDTNEVIFEAYNEVDITSNLIHYENYLYFLIADLSRHLSYLVKMDLSNGKVIWTYHIDGFSFGFHIPKVTGNRIILQNDTRVWLIAQDGSLYGEYELDIECITCSPLVYLKENKFVCLADFGLYEVEIESSLDQISKIPKELNEPRYVFLSHASEDKYAIVEPFYSACEIEGVSAWLDAAELKWGDPLVSKIQEGISAAKYIIIFISESFLQKEWPQRELETALSLDVDGKKIVLPVILGMTHEELALKNPFISSKVYMSIEDYNPRVKVDELILRELIDSLKRLMNY